MVATMYSLVQSVVIATTMYSTKNVVIATMYSTKSVGIALIMIFILLWQMGD